MNFELAASNNGLSSHESTAQQMVSDPTLVHVLVRFLSGTNTNGTSQHSSQVGPTATQAMHEFLGRLQVHLSSTCPQMFSEFLLKLIHILSSERYGGTNCSFSPFCPYQLQESATAAQGG